MKSKLFSPDDSSGIPKADQAKSMGPVAFWILSITHWFFVLGSVIFHFLSLSVPGVGIYLPFFILGMLFSWPLYDSSLSNIQRRLITTKFLHWFFIVAFIYLYAGSFYQPELLIPMIIVSVIGVVSWIPYNACPLHAWENNLRKRLNKEESKFFLFGKIDKLLGGRLPKHFALYLVGLGIFLRLMVK
jgi:hypothetical protein